MPDLPTGIVTFLFTDIEGSTRLWEEHPEKMELALARHDSRAAAIVRKHGGTLVKSRGEGDSLFAVFGHATDAVAAACALQRAFQAEPWPAETPVRVRMALHTGEATLRQGDYFGAAVNRCARLRAAAHGGQVLLSGATQQQVHDLLPAEVQLHDLGRHRLRDLSQSEQIYLLVHPALPAVDTPLRSLQAFSHNLPVQLTSFVGREQEIADVKRLMATTRLLTLTGAGGTGKTRLSLQVAADLLEEYEDGIWLVELAALSDPSLVPQTVATALGVREEPGKALTQILVEYLKPKQLLLLLDNCEHLLGGGAALADALLRGCPDVRILATSREGLNIAGELAYRVPSLSLPNPGELPPVESLPKYEAMRLFIERADFKVTSQNAPALVQVCYRLDGIPLAIELAAARVRALPLEELNERLDDRFRLLTGGSRTALPRQQTLRALIDWSYDLLSEPERLLLRRLSVFAGGWTLEAAETVSGADPLEKWAVLDLLTSLVEKSLVVYEESEGRYRLVETMRQYARDRLQEAGETAALRGRHRDFFAALAERAGPELFGSEQTIWVRRLEREHDNLRAALAWSLESGDGEAGLRMGGSLWRFWHIQSYAEEGRERLAAALAQAGTGSGTCLHAQALDGAAVLSMRAARDLAAAQAHYEEMLAIGHDLGDRKVTGTALNGLGHVALLRGDRRGAHALFEQGLGLAREVGHTWEAAFALHCMGYLFVLQGECDTAWPLLEESLAIRRGRGDLWSVYWTLSVMAIVAEERGDYTLARALLEECVTICRELRKSPELRVLRGLANTARIQGDFATARAHYEEMRAISCEKSHRVDLASSVYGLGWVAINEEDFGAARSCFEETLRIGHETGEEWLIAASLEGLGEVARYQGDDAAACSFHEECLARWREPEGRGVSPGFHFHVWPLTAGGSLLGLGRVAQKQGDTERAAALYRESLVRYRKTSRKPEIARSVEALASLIGVQGQPERAGRLFGAAEAFREAAGAPIPPGDRVDYERAVAAVLAALGEEAFSAARAEGRAMTLKHAIAYALDEPAGE